MKKPINPAKMINDWTIAHFKELFDLYVDGKKVDYKVVVEKKNGKK